MRKTVFGHILFSTISLSVFILCSIHSKAQRSVKQISPIHYVDPFIGVDGNGNVFPGACLPNSLVSVSPDTDYPHSTSGYASYRPITGFSHGHTSGTGGVSRYGNIRILPVSGDIDLNDTSSFVSNEKATPAYYAAHINKWNIDVELTLSARAGFHKYTFHNTTAKKNILIDVAAVLKSKQWYSGPSLCTNAEFTITNDTTMEGYAGFKGGWGGANPYTVYFVIRTNVPFKKYGVFKDKKLLPGKKNDSIASDKNFGAFLTFNNKGKTVKIKTGISYSGMQNARKHLNELQSWNFEEVKKNGQKQWQDYLGRIKVDGGSEEQKIVFYSCLYHTAITPRDITGDNPKWTSDKPHFWDYYCIWDTYRAANPLLMLIAPEIQSRMIECMLDIYKHRGWLADAWIAGDFAQLQGGTNGDVLLTEAILKDIGGFDYELAYEAMKKNATVNSDNPGLYGKYLSLYEKYGYLPTYNVVGYENPRCAVSRTQEYAYNDFCIALAAKKLGKETDYNRFLKRSLNSFHLFNEETHFFWAKDTTGNFFENFWPELFLQPWRGPYYEGSAWHYSMSAQHHIAKLIDLHGGDTHFVHFLDELFEGFYYNPTNQSDIHVPYLYIYAGRPDKTAERLRSIMDISYRHRRDGLPGNDDAGTLSAWYVWASLGISAIPGQDIYLLSSPVFKKSTITLGKKGKKLEIVAKNLSDKNIYIVSARLNGKELNRAWLKHHEIKNGGTIEFTLGDKPLEWANRNRPPSFDHVLK